MDSLKRIFITGGASGLGLAIAHKYAAEGYKVAIGDINDEVGQNLAKEIAKQYQVACKYYHCDVTKVEDFIAVEKDLMQHWNGVDVVVNNAGVAASAPIDKGTLEDWDWIIDINLMGVVRGCKVFTPMFKKQGSGYFINIASMAGVVFLPNMSSYNTTKAAVVALSETLKLEFYDRNIGVTVVCPSFFKTQLDKTMRANEAMKDMVNKLFEKSPIGAEDVANMIYKGHQSKEFYLVTHPKGKAAFQMKKSLSTKMYFESLYNETRQMRKK